MNMHHVHWEAWQAVRPLGGGKSGQVFEIQHSGAAGVESAALKLLTIPTEPGGAARLVEQGQPAEAVKERLHSRMEAAVSAYNLMFALKAHPNVLSCEEPVYDAAADGFGWEIKVKTAMETPVSQAYPQGMAEEQVLRLGTDVATALALCREGGLVHEGVKASNVFALADGSFQLGDFGAAKATGMPCSGDRSCMSPEVYWGMNYDHTTDVYALGILMYTMLNGGYLPLTWPGMTEEERRTAMENRLGGQPLPAPCSGSPALQQLVLRACAYEPAQRFGSAWELRMALLQLQGMDGAAPLWPEPTLIPEALPEQAPTLRPEAPPVQTPTAPKQETPAATGKNNSMLYLILAVAAAVLVLGVVCFFTVHIWPEVSCNEIAKCTICGKTSTKVQSHLWDDATCLKPATCAYCGEADGVALGHQLSAPTREQPATCAVCGATEGDVLQPSLWVMQVISTGWQGGYKQSVEDGSVLLSFPQDPGFVGSGMLATDVYRKSLPDAFEVQWDQDTARITPAAQLETGVYHLQFSSGDSGAMLTVCYGYEEECYLSQQEYFWSGEIWCSKAHGRYLMVSESGVSTTDKTSGATSFDSAMDMMGVEKVGGELRPVGQEPVVLQSMRYAQGGEEKYTVFIYEGQYLACNPNGTVYFSATLDENCFWVEGR